eukprot:CAMPEP_0173459104 /NCGR_PEP_ID=MMETSP1357-20121228/60826_1 /TAXON_ID=77926 /ORGANISM="Hemiselmis rufescens, Strain PCC563" /LENGTH=91 /DNA_ID=CAMNT_0014426531 /DNA_START=38 /DNA_END=310 /DNA_ORIENTATION=+
MGPAQDSPKSDTLDLGPQQPISHKSRDKERSRRGARLCRSELQREGGGDDLACHAQDAELCHGGGREDAHGPGARNLRAVLLHQAGVPPDQ